MHGKVDKIVPFHMGKKMYELANEPKILFFRIWRSYDGI